MIQLHYTTLPTARDTRALGIFRKAAFVCGMLPMLAGLVVLLAFWATKRGYWMEVGFVTALVGVGIVVLGTAAVIVASVIELRRSRAGQARFRWRGLVVAASLLS